MRDTDSRRLRQPRRFPEASSEAERDPLPRMHSRRGRSRRGGTPAVGAFPTRGPRSEALPPPGIRLFSVRVFQGCCAATLRWLSGDRVAEEVAVAENDPIYAR